MKNADGVLLRLVMKYNVRLKNMDVVILFGRSVIMEAIASESGW